MTTQIAGPLNKTYPVMMGWLLLFCLKGTGSSAQSGSRSPDFHVFLGIQAGPAVMLAPFEYSTPHPELRQPSPKPALSFYNFFVGVEFLKNEVLFSYGDSPMVSGGYVIYDADRGLIYRNYGPIALNSFFSLSYKRKVWTRKKRNRSGRLQQEWRLYVGGYVGIANSPRSKGGAGSLKSIRMPDSVLQLEVWAKHLTNRGKYDYFISFGPDIQLRFPWTKWLSGFINVGLRITPHVVDALQITYNLYQAPDSEMKTTKVNHRIINLNVSVGILFHYHVKKRTPPQLPAEYPWKPSLGSR